MDVLTPWFPPSIRPARDGLYLTRLGPSAVLPTMMLWDGQCWRYIDGMLAKWPGHQRGTEWRGLAFDPSRARLEVSLKWAAGALNLESGWWVPVR